MHLNVITKTSREFGRALSRNSPTILTALGVGGLISTVILAIKATPKAMEILEMEEKYRLSELHDPTYGKPIDPIETVELTWKCYIPTVAMGLTTIVCMIGSNTIHLRRNAALASIFSITETALKEYQEKVVEKIGENKEAKILGDIADDKLKENPIADKTIIVTNKGAMLCYDAMSGRYFYSDIQTLKAAQNDFNNRLMSEMSIPLNEFYVDIGLEPIDMGFQTGWVIEKGMMNIDFGSRLTPEGQPCIVLQHKRLPTNIWG